MPENGDRKPSSLVWAFLDHLARFRFFTANQVKTVWNIPPERLDALASSGWILDFELTDPSTDAPPRRVYALGRAGALSLATRSGRDPRSYPYLTRGKLKFSLMFLEHTLARNEFALTLMMATRKTPGVELLLWEHRPERIRDVVHLAGKGGEYKRQPLVADGFFGLRVGARPRGRREVYFLVEIDRGTVSIPRMASRYRGYHEWWRTGAHRHRFGIPNIRILTVGKGKRRVERLRSAAEAPRSAIHVSGLFLFTQDTNVLLANSKQILEPIWQRATGDGKHSLAE